jgi:hypothetical protein
MFFTLWESRGYYISFVVKGSRYVATASPLTPRSHSILDFCNDRVKSSAWPDRIVFITPIPKSLVSQTRLFHRREIELGTKERS